MFNILEASNALIIQDQKHSKRKNLNVKVPENITFFPKPGFITAS